jgi:hypothetical protein
MIMKQITFSLAVAALMIAVAAGLTYAKHLGLVGPEAPMRGTMALVGIVLTLNANYIPKSISKCSAATQRVAGWAFFLSGLAYAAIWAFAPIAIAADASMWAVGIAIASVISYYVWARSRSA